MDDLPAEVLVAMRQHMDWGTQRVVACVSHRWRAISDAERRSKRPRRCSDGQRCRTRQRCAMTYATRAITQRRWAVLEWMIDETGPFEGPNDIDKRACEAAAADGDARRLVHMVNRQKYRADWTRVFKVAGQYKQRRILGWLDRKEIGKRNWDKMSALKGALKGRHKRTIEWAIKNIRWKWLPTEAAKYGHLDLLKRMVASEGKDSVKDPWWARETAKGGHVEVIQWLEEQGCRWDSSVCVVAAGKGHLEVIKWATVKDRNRVDKRRTLCAAAEGGHVAVLKWMWANGYRQTAGAGCAGAASRNGHVDAFKWAIEHGGASDRWLCDGMAALADIATIEWCLGKGIRWCFEDVQIALIVHGHVHVLEWEAAARARSVPGGASTTAPGLASKRRMSRYEHVQAAEGSCAKTLEWAQCLGVLDIASYGADMFESAVESERVDVLAWLLSKGCTWDASRCAAAAARKGSRDMLMWLAEQGCTYDERTCGEAIVARCYQMVAWLRAQGAPWNEGVCAWLAGGKRPAETLKWARSQGCPWDANTTGRAAASRAWGALKWAIEMGCPWDDRVERALCLSDRGQGSRHDEAAILGAIEDEIRHPREE